MVTDQEIIDLINSVEDDGLSEQRMFVAAPWVIEAAIQYRMTVRELIEAIFEERVAQ